MYRFEFSNVRVKEKYDVVTGILKKISLILQA